METGIIKLIDNTRGLGYLTTTTGDEIVLITLGLEDQLYPGESVNYNIRQTRVGLIAVDVQPTIPTHGHGTVNAA